MGKKSESSWVVFFFLNSKVNWCVFDICGIRFLIWWFLHRFQTGFPQADISASSKRDLSQ